MSDYVMVKRKDLERWKQSTDDAAAYVNNPAMSPSLQEECQAAALEMKHALAQPAAMVPLDVKDERRDAIEDAIDGTLTTGYQGGAAPPDGHWLWRWWNKGRQVKEYEDHLVERCLPTQAARDVLAERHRQISAEGYTPEHDDQYVDGDLAAAAASYALVWPVGQLPMMWPWAPEHWKPRDELHNLKIAGALIQAEMERLYRAKAKAQKTAPAFSETGDRS